MNDPRVSFVVPCYNLAHLLRECVSSILTQTYGDFEVLIMDDCSPDQTPEVAGSFGDPRVRHIRNQPNLGHLRNYNKGIEMARGEYVWLISADDRLRTSTVLERYVKCMAEHPNAGYVFCPGIGLENGKETGILEYAYHGDQDAIWNGRQFLLKLLNSNSILAASGMVRKQCYDKVSYFPLDMPYAGDWYMWCIFALHYDVAYLAEPMVNYRLHPQTMTSQFTRERSRVFTTEGPAVLWRMKHAAELAGHAQVANKCEQRLIDRYANYLMAELWKGSPYCMTFQEYEESLRQHAARPGERSRINARVYAWLGDEYYLRGDFAHALEFYGRALRQDAAMPKIWAKYALLASGKAGIGCREGLSVLRRIFVGRAGQFSSHGKPRGA